MSTAIEQSVEARLIAAMPPTPIISAKLQYNQVDPFAVRMTFPAPATLADEDVCWTFARELLASGLDRPVGEGDIQVRPYGYDCTVLELHAPVGTAVLHVHSSDIRCFLELTAALVPVGLEHLHLDLDHGLRELMRGTS
ncbi:SsgA family sporulation/cell division regulator [Streptomyces sp. NPDC005065]|uniref:SsgA family sporulation/cell division regulator n=1 Tax=unclassified Streptomyces TaxID=2593676 RepID=UPI0033A57506